MRCKILYDPDIPDAVREWTHALGGDQEDLTKLALADAPPHLDERGIAALHVADGGEDAAALACGEDLAARVCGGGERLLDQEMDPRGGELPCPGQMLLGGKRKDREVRCSRCEQGCDRREELLAVAHRTMLVAGGVHGPGEADTGGVLQQAGVMAAHHPEADDGPADHRAGRRRGHGALGYPP
ncbi:unannotated protein [freshwater metagenome]|uniref:Unannotated protein n=1 Tax=freshwater metagenome TaxID=449393 RepID=A0A6J7EDU1_9ZZZZ